MFNYESFPNALLPKKQSCSFILKRYAHYKSGVSFVADVEAESVANFLGFQQFPVSAARLTRFSADQSTPRPMVPESANAA
ncbi:MAG: hypothetical protein AB7O38_31135 [Pirellulaceae bacterium]